MQPQFLGAFESRERRHGHHLARLMRNALTRVHLSRNEKRQINAQTLVKRGPQVKGPFARVAVENRFGAVRAVFFFKAFK